jgi:hypothetical protein
MSRKKHKLLLLSFMLMMVLSTSLSFSQFEPETKPAPQREEEALPAPPTYSIFQEIPPGYWIRINAFKTVSIIIIILAFILGFVSFFVGVSAGASINKSEVRKAILSALMIAIFARPIEVNAHYYLGVGLSYIMPNSYAFGIAGFIVYILWMMYVIAIPVYLYESFTVTAKEAHPAQF